MATKAWGAHPVAWLEGMFLRPQHLQQRDLFDDARLAAAVRSLDPFHWGVRALEVNEAALSDHRFEVLRLDAVLPGGLALRYPGNCTLETREFDPAAASTDVFLAVRRLATGEAQSASADAGARDVRYRVRAEEVPDLSRGANEAEVDFLVPNARLFLGGEKLEIEQHDAFRLARIAATGELKRPFALAKDFAPPLLAVQASPLLDDELARLLGQLAARMRVVAGRTATIAIADLPRMWMRYTLARMTPLLRHLLSTGATRPFELYSALVETAGALAAFSLQEPVELPRYDHDDLYRCFHEVIAFIERELEKALPDRFTELEMRHDRTAYTTKELTRELVEARNHFFIAIKAAVDAQELVALVREFGKCAARDELPSIEMLKLAGLRLEPLPAAPTEIAARVGFSYWKLEPHGKLWNRVRDDCTLALSLGKLEGADVRLYVVSAEA
ncbi:MAG TPA: type VI secretion system baseplate subunit TssK [Myxococcota bacterium]|nr:type VI secretion system baseplate subunit TssK [Myxococcota bacterium]